MDIKELNNIIVCMDLPQIHRKLEQHGYRSASKSGVWEFDPIAIANAKQVKNSEQYEDVFDDKVYIGDIHTHVKAYPSIEFIVITVNKIYRDRNNLEIPIIMELYTNAPINEEYEREQSKIGKCAICKKNFTISELCKINGQLICDNCFGKKLRTSRINCVSKLIKKKLWRIKWTKK